ncbi:MAG: glycosyltransferase [Pirellulales bacterium]
MRLLALIEKPGHVCYRYRLQAHAQALTERNWSLQAAPLARTHREWLGQLKDVAAADAVVLQRRLLPAWWLWLLRRSAKVLIYDLDDAMFFRDSNAAKAAASARRLRRFRATVRLADAVTAGNGFLADKAAAHGAAHRVHRLPTCVDPALYRLARHTRRGSQTRLAWIGSKSTMPSLRLAAGGLAEAGRRLAGLELRLICDCTAALPEITVAPRRWSSETEAQELADADIGISWLPDHPWSLGKCGLKVLQYMAAGLPVVANPIGVHREMIVDGQTGFLAESPAAWAAAIERLAADPALRAAMGARGRELVDRQYSASRWGTRLAALVDSTASAAVSQTPSSRWPVPAWHLRAGARRTPR